MSERFKSYTVKGFLVGLSIGMLLSLLCILIVYACEVAFNPGGGSTPEGFCETITIFYLPFLILFVFTAYGGFASHIIPAVILTVVFICIGGLLGRFIKRRQKAGVLSRTTKSVFIIVIAVIYVLIIFSAVSVYLDRKDYLISLRTEHKETEEFKKETSFLEPSYLPIGLQKVHIDNKVYALISEDPENMRLQYIYRCNKDNERTNL